MDYQDLKALLDSLSIKEILDIDINYITTSGRQKQLELEVNDRGKIDEDYRMEAKEQ